MFLLFCACGSGGRGPHPVPGADLVFVGGDIITLDASESGRAKKPGDKSQPTALAIRDGLILAVGSDREIRRHVGRKTRVVELAGKSVTPGLVDSHAHLLGLGTALETVDLVGAKSAEEATGRAAAFAATLGKGEAVEGRGWDQNRWTPAQFPDRKTLDERISDRPVYLRRVDGHAVWLNSVALEQAGISAATADPPGGRIVRDKSGRPTGVLIDNAMDLALDKLPEPDAKVLRRRIVRGAEVAIANGLTQVHEMGISDRAARVYAALADQDSLPIKVHAYLSGTPEVVAALGRRLYDEVRNGREMFVLRGVKVYADGALGSRGAALVAPYSDEPGNRGLFIHPPDELKAIALAVAESGWQLAVHAIGDAANRAVLDAYQGAFEKTKRRDLRFRVEHAQVLAPEEIPRFAKLGVIASMQPTHCTSDMAWAVERLGPERARGAYAWRSLLKTGAALAAGSDFPVEGVAPLAGLYAFVTRQDAAGQPKDGFNPAERLTLVEAIRAFSLGGAYASFAESFRGRLRAGAVADVTVYDRKLEGGAALLSTQIFMTVINGAIVYQRGK